MKASSERAPVTPAPAPRRPPLLSADRIGWAAMAGLIGCVACCALPPLLAFGLGGSAVASVVALAGGHLELLVGGGAATLTLAFLAIRGGRPKASSATGACAKSCPVGSEGDGCGCGPTPASPHASGPAGGGTHDCTLTADEFSPHVEAYRAIFVHLVRSETIDRTLVRWTFRDIPGLDATLEALAARERRCCSFFRIQILRRPGGLLWETETNTEATEVLAVFHRLPELLTSSDTATARAALVDAGLTFARTSGTR